MDEVTTGEEEGFPITLRPFVEKGFEQLMDGINRLPDVDVIVRHALASEKGSISHAQGGGSLFRL